MSNTFEAWWAERMGDRMRQSKYLARAAWKAVEAENARLREHYDNCPLARGSINVSGWYVALEAAEAAKESKDE